MNLAISSLLCNCEYPSHGAIFNYYYFAIHPLLNNSAPLYPPSLMCGDFVQWQRENKNTSTEMPPPGNYRSVLPVALAKAAILPANNFWVKMVERNWFEGHSVFLNTCLKNITDFISSLTLFTLRALGLHILVEGWQSVRRALRLLKISGKVFPGSALIVHPLKRSSNPLLCTRLCFERASKGGRAGKCACMGSVQLLLTAIDCRFTVLSCRAQ